jgi:hypothetical protein
VRCNLLTDFYSPLVATSLNRLQYLHTIFTSTEISGTWNETGLLVIDG